MVATADIRTIRIEPSVELPRRLVIDVYRDGVIRVQVYARRGGRMLAFGMGEAQISPGTYGPVLWAGHAAFDLTDDDAKQLAEALGLGRPSQNGCSHCGAKGAQWCSCRPIAETE
jgi:hypothetical protein